MFYQYLAGVAPSPHVSNSLKDTKCYDQTTLQRTIHLPEQPPIQHNCNYFYFKSRLNSTQLLFLQINGKH